MGCDVYDVEGTQIRFSEDDGTVGCLCTFPHNDDETVSLDRIESLALLGAAVVLLHHGILTGPVYLPVELPGWIRAGVADTLWGKK